LEEITTIGIIVTGIFLAVLPLPGDSPGLQRGLKNFAIKLSKVNEKN